MPFSQPSDRKILFVDLNSFFASCEQADEPTLIGQPVIVIPTKNSCALSASYEAKAYGIRTGTLEREARFLCPQVIIRQARPKRYMAYHHRFVEVLHDLTPRVTVRSVDEASVQLCRNEDPWQLGRAIKEALWKRLSPAMNCSIGIGPNLFLAKLGTELEKPDGLSEISIQTLKETYQRVQLRDLCGINYAMERQLHQLGIYSPLDFYQADPEYLCQHLGIMGERWWLQLHGYPSYEWDGLRKSLSHSHVLPPQSRAPDQAYITLHHLATKVGRRLRREGYQATHIGFYLRFADRTREYVHYQISPTADTLSLIRQARQAWSELRPNRPILQIAIWTHGLVPSRILPTPLFPQEQKRQRLAQALDTINDRYGANVVRLAVLDQPASRAPDRISFNALFDIEHE